MQGTSERKIMTSSLLRTIVVLVSLASSTHCQYKPTWESLDSRPLPSWYDDAKFGIIMHWGLYSVPSFGVAAEWFWNYWKSGSPQYQEFMTKTYGPDFQYADFAPMFKAELFDPDVFAALVEKSGAKYFLLTSKHHEGWTNWRSNVSWNWNSVDNGPHRDLVGALADSIRANTNVKFGLYFSQFEWYNPLFLKDQASGYKTNTYVEDVSQPQLHDIVTKYRPEYIFSDGDVGPPEYWKSLEFLAWLYNESPVKDTVVVNDRWGTGVWCKHGGVWTCSDRYNPGVLVKHKWENAMTVDKMSWGLRRNADIFSYMSIEELIYQLASTVSCGGNMLLNVGPSDDGRIVPIFQERLVQMGTWLEVNGEAIYGTRPWRVQNDTNDIWYTEKPDALYAIVLKWPSKTNKIVLREPVSTPETRITMLGYSGNFIWKATNPKGIVIDVPPVPTDTLPSKWAWVFKIINVS